MIGERAMRRKTAKEIGCTEWDESQEVCTQGGHCDCLWLARKRLKNIGKGRAALADKDKGA